MNDRNTEAWALNAFSLGLKYSIIIDDLKQLQLMAIMATNEDDQETAEEIARACYHISEAIENGRKYEELKEKHAQTAKKTASTMTKEARLARSQKANEAKRKKAEARKNGHIQVR